MILLVHMLFGAAIASNVQNVYLAVILAFLGHYLLDLLPHVEYSIKKIRVALDFFIGLLLIFIFSNNHYIIYICAMVAIIPDGLSVIGMLIESKILKTHSFIHQEKIHFLKHKKISNFWRISSQMAVAIISIILLKI
ncbi:MAG: hypothetical protein NTV36_00985 [Candidatus Staskawiczbacteria bacterium]|nr:hypothetical protein [Candidatus Staskawiczbacteria bacterium]